MTLNEGCITQFLSSLSARGASPETLRGYRTDLLSLLNHKPSDPAMSLEDLTAEWLTTNSSSWSPRTMARRLSSVRSWAKWSGHPDFLPGYRLPTPPVAEPHPLPEGAVGVLAMMRTTRNSRHKALIALTGMLGLRVGEAVSVRPEDFEIVGDDVTLTVRGKGKKQRIIPVSASAWLYIEQAHRTAIEKGTTVVRLSQPGARQAITRHGARAGLARHVKSHDMRATALTEAYQRTKDLRAVQEIAGHANPATTTIYTGVSMAAKRAAMGA